MKTRGALVAALALLITVRAGAQIHYSSGQDVVPVFEGWERNPDGSFNMVFGYMNRNYEEEVEVPIGPDNRIGTGDPDQGQPTHFYPRRQEFAFKVRVPQDWGEKDLVWTLASHGKVEKAYGSLLPIYQLSTLVYLENRRGAGALTFPEEPNQPPAIEMVGSAERTAVAGEPLELSVDVSDDGYPRPRARRGAPRDVVRWPGPAGQAVVRLDPGVRLGVTWVLYRGAGSVTFEPMRVAAAGAGTASDSGPLAGRATTKVTFHEPGTYRLRAYADDGVLATPLDVNVTVRGKADR